MDSKIEPPPRPAGRPRDNASALAAVILLRVLGSSARLAVGPRMSRAHH